MECCVADIETSGLCTKLVSVEDESVGRERESDAFGRGGFVPPGPLQYKSRFLRVDPVVLHISPSYDNYVIWAGNRRGKVGGSRYVRKADIESIISHLKEMYSFSAKVGYPSNVQGGYHDEAKSWEFTPRGDSPAWIHLIDIYCILKGIRTFSNYRDLVEYAKATECTEPENVKPS